MWLRAFMRAIDELFQSGRVVYKGYVDDPRTTDNAWIETTAFHFHCSAEIGDKLPLAAGDDARKVVWLDVSPASETRYANLYASHREWVDRVAETFAPHEKARSQQLHIPIGAMSTDDDVYPKRTEFDDEYVPWSTPLLKYAPPDYTAPEVRKNAITTRSASNARKIVQWADPTLIDMANAEGLSARHTFESPITFDPDSLRPRNPRGRTGLAGRGRLGRWGANHAVDPIVTRYHPRTNQLQVVVVRRRDTNEWALPGKFLVTGEGVPTGLRNAFEPKAMNFKGQRQEEDRMRLLLDELFVDDIAERTVYKGYVDDPRNTDNAWVETVAVHFHCSRELGAKIRLQAKSKDERAQLLRRTNSFVNRITEASKLIGRRTPRNLAVVDEDNVRWADVDENLLLFASHKQWVQQVAQQVMASAAPSLPPRAHMWPACLVWQVMASAAADTIREVDIRDGVCVRLCCHPLGHGSGRGGEYAIRRMEGAPASSFLRTLYEVP